MSLIELKKIKKIYPIGDKGVYHALKNIDLQIEKGEFAALIGPSGSGKSTTMHILGCLDTPTSGTYFLNGKDVSKMNDNELAQIRNKEIGFVFQSFNLLPRLTVLQNVLLPFTYNKGTTHEEEYRIALSAIKKVGLEDKINNKTNQLSGGQVQRVAIARSVVMNPSLILADEPTGNLDSKTSKEIMNMLAEFNKSGDTIIVVTHDPEIASYAKRTIYIKDGLIVDKL